MTWLENELYYWPIDTPYDPWSLLQAMHARPMPKENIHCFSAAGGGHVRNSSGRKARRVNRASNTAPLK
jgi:hypothetical protein